MAINGLRHIPLANLISMANNIGELCEFIATEYISEEYPSKDFYILRNIFYQKNRKQILGELDVVVFSKSTQKAVHIFEVKCQQNEKKAYKKAISQLERFKGHVEACLKKKSQIKISDGQENFSCSLFSEPKYDALMPQNSRAVKSRAQHFGIDLVQIYFLQSCLKLQVLP